MEIENYIQELKIDIEMLMLNSMVVAIEMTVRKTSS